ncbi:MAG: methyltransferase domain-containing protein [Candidatus Aenigmatarchaeota archaeon]
MNYERVLKMKIDTVTKQNEYWNNEANTVEYEKNNFSIFDDEKAKKKIIFHLDKVIIDPAFIVGDLGCGPGHILPYLSKMCKEVIKIDYAANMLKEAQRRNSHLRNITYRRGDMRNLGRWHGNFDVVVATNSILPGSISEADRMIAEIHKSLKDGGVFVAVMALIETSNYLARLKFERLISEGISEIAAIRRIRKEYQEEKKFDGIFGFMRDGSNNLVQKYFYRDELKLMLKKAGFRALSIGKLRYGWEHCRKYNYDYFPGADEIYDWLVIAKK